MMPNPELSIGIFEEILPCDVAHKILGDYMSYHHQYKRINKRAKIRFERRDWKGIQNDSNERIERYKKSIQNTTNAINELLEDNATNATLWKEIKNLYFEEILNFNTRNIAETYFNSVFRHVHRATQDLNEELMFIKPTLQYGEQRSQIQIYHSLQLVHPIEHVVEQILNLFDIKAQFAHIDIDINNIAEALRVQYPQDQQTGSPIKVELIKSLFFRNKCAYIVGRIVKDYKASPIIIPLLHDSSGVSVDAVLLDAADASSIFSYSRAYFLTDTDMALNMVEFLHSILPKKSLSELYNSLGFVKHAKTEFYREFEYHMGHTEDEFVIAPGVKGMVMTVFTLPSYNMAFKVIKDKFDPPKKVTPRIVKEKYEIVSKHDRVGRMVDSHEFRNLQFDTERFSPELLSELHKTIPSKISVENSKLTINHLYIEKKLIPLDIYLSKSTQIEQDNIMRDYGSAIKELASVNIFPGDLLLKNFGVNRRKKVVFYDYDEIEFVTDLSFKKIPQSTHDEDDWMADSWFTPNLNDVFPEQFPAFIVGDKRLQNLLINEHYELFEEGYWKEVQNNILNDILMSIFPYSTSHRFK